jgi:hypothetical protein
LPKSARAPTYLNYPRPSPEIAANAHNGSPLMLRYLMYTAAARWPGQLLGRSTTRRLAALIPIQRGRHGLQSISTAPLHSACPGRPSTNQPLGSNSSATLLATSRWWRVFESVNAETERPTQPHLGDHGGTRTPPRDGAQIRVSPEPGPVVWDGQSPACPKLRLEIDHIQDSRWRTHGSIPACC